MVKEEVEHLLPHHSSTTSSNFEHLVLVEEVEVSSTHSTLEVPSLVHFSFYSNSYLLFYYTYTYHSLQL